MFFETDNLSHALVVLSKGLMQHGVWVERGKNAAGSRCLEFPFPVLVEISNPHDRYCRVPERNWNKTLGWVESLWIARGDNALDMPGAYVKNLYSFSDDGKFMRAGYGPRIRDFGENFSIMRIQEEDGTERQMYRQYGDRKTNVGIDQLRFVVEKFKEDLGTREACITIHDPIADDFDMGNGGAPLLVTKDTPCTRSLHFMVVDGKMNMYVDMRSNDLIWGFSAVNVFNFTLMQEYVAMMVGVPVGKYYHKADNLHIYEGSYELAKSIADKYDENAFKNSPVLEWEGYMQSFTSLKEFDSLISRLTCFEMESRGENDLPMAFEEAMDMLNAKFIGHPLFMDWAKIFVKRWTKKSVTFANPYLNSLFEGK